MKNAIKRIFRRKDKDGNILNRGITFSFNEKGKFTIGSQYRAIVNVTSKKIFVVPATEKIKGSTWTISRKKSVEGYKPLIDIRKSEIKNTLKDVEILDINIKNDIITIEAFSEEKNNQNSASGALNKTIKKYKCVQKLICTKAELKQVVGGEIYCSTNNENLNNVISIVSWFSGAGMLDYAFTSTENHLTSTTPTNTDTNNKKNKYKFEVISAVEMDKAACKSYKENIGDHIIEGDVLTLEFDNLPSGYLFLAGVPCKPFSNANRTSRLEKHKDIGLLDRTVQFIKEKQFPIFVIENVPQILTAKDKGFFNMVIESLPEYKIEAKVLQDNECGGYSTRKRAFIIGSKIGKPDFSVIEKVTGGTVKDALSKIDSSWANLTSTDITSSGEDTQKKMSFIPQGKNWRSIPKEYMNPGMLKTVLYEEKLKEFAEKCNGDKKLIREWEKQHASEKGATQANVYYRLHPDEPSCTLVNYRKPVITHPYENRTLYVSEASALSGFDKNFIFKGNSNEKQQQVGNGVPFALGSAVRLVVENLLEKAGILPSINTKITKKQSNKKEKIAVIEEASQNISLVENINGQLSFAF